MTTNEQDIKELRREWSDKESSTRQSRTYALQKLSIYSAFADAEELRQGLKVILAPNVLARNVPQETIDAFMFALDDRTRQYMFSDFMEILGLFRPFEIALFREAIGGRALHSVLVDLEEYYRWSKDAGSSYGEFYYRLALLLEQGIELRKAVELTGAESAKLYEIAQELLTFHVPGQTLTDFFKASDFPEWIVLVLKAAERQGRSAVALRKLADYSITATSY